MNIEEIGKRAEDFSVQECIELKACCRLQRNITELIRP